MTCVASPCVILHEESNEHLSEAGSEKVKGSNKKDHSRCTKQTRPQQQTPTPLPLKPPAGPGRACNMSHGTPPSLRSVQPRIKKNRSIHLGPAFFHS
ncbi:hypothetical protein Pmani_018704 [Petrolisthes manimaculis]|uniref:Uncharacterized protein n=1 Tax=Petrolisthes manimaculis TaxID=1843537 RepID=A0AAE1PL16_9EUCA|nr:hypothetical protein Pmani_018704 [Petrolisthes manimaculis]